MWNLRKDEPPLLEISENKRCEATGVICNVIKKKKNLWNKEKCYRKQEVQGSPQCLKPTISETPAGIHIPNLRDVIYESTC